MEPHSPDGTRSLVPMKQHRNYATCLIDRYKSNERLITRISNMQYKIIIYFLLTTDTDTCLDPKITLVACMTPHTMHTPCLQLTVVRLKSLDFLLEPQPSDGSGSIFTIRYTVIFVTCFRDGNPNEWMIIHISDRNTKSFCLALRLTCKPWPPRLNCILLMAAGP